MAEAGQLNSRTRPIADFRPDRLRAAKQTPAASRVALSPTAPLLLCSMPTAAWRRIGVFHERKAMVLQSPRATESTTPPGAQRGRNITHCENARGRNGHPPAGSLLVVTEAVDAPR
jgi:hypothetical protein